jgi:SAM-dependent methyltransferase
MDPAEAADASGGDGLAGADLTTHPDADFLGVGHPLDPREPLSFATSAGATRGSYMLDYGSTLDELIDALPAGGTVAELGSGANPRLAVHPRVASGEVELLQVDISQVELDKAPSIGQKVCGDVAAAGFSLGRSVDLVCSQMLAEHVRDGEQFLRNVAAMLEPGGRYLQVSPVLFTLPFIVNRVVPESFAATLLDIFQPRDHDRHGKFPARYSFCRGPGKGQLRAIDQVGLRVVAARGYFGHNYYRRIPVARDLEPLKSSALARHPVPQLCSFAVYLLAAAGPSSDLG